MGFRKVLIANRGEIAVRIMRSLKALNITGVALYTPDEENDLHCRMADEAYPLGEGGLEQTWLNIPAIIDIAVKSGADAIHPGYGFLSENAQFASACEQAGIVFIGPRSEVIRQMGSKTIAASFAAQAGLPLLPRMEGSPEELTAKAAELGFPLLVKAAAGGGGKGMIKVEKPERLADAIQTASLQARRYFADDTVYVEKYLENPRHIEVQVLADQHGKVLHLMERECTLQRNHQKVVEEAPSPSLDKQTRNLILNSAVNLARAVGYTNAGTVEFIMDGNRNFYFLEMNTRIQVEHPVTEAITGLDIVEQQIRIAEGQKLQMEQDDILAKGHAIEMRLYAEDPALSYRPSAGFLKKLVFPKVKGLRVDSSIENSGWVHPSFDAMVAKIISFGDNRPSAISRMQQALRETFVHGIKSNIDLLRNIAADQKFLDNQISTQSISENITEWSSLNASQQYYPLSAALLLWLERFGKRENQPWRMAGKEDFMVNGQLLNITYHPHGISGLHFKHGSDEYKLEVLSITGGKIDVLWNNNPLQLVCNYSHRDMMILLEGRNYHVEMPEIVPLPKVNLNGAAQKIADLKASLFGKVLRINVTENQKVKNGDPLLVLESMKMENTILAPGDTRITKVNVKVGDQVSDGQTLICFES